MNEQRDRTFSILKALAILLVVTAHAAAPTYVSRFAYMVSVPAFFVCAGYFFRPDYLERKSTFVVRRVRRLYFPFVKWSLLFLLLHNLLFPLGLLSETYGNAAGGVTHPYDWHTAMQNLWSIVFNMSGYDVFLAGAFWFFRALLLASIAFLVAVQRRHARQMVEKSHLTSGRRRHPHPLARTLAVVRRTSHHRRGARRLPRTDGHHLHEHRLLVPPQQQRSHRRRLEQSGPRSHLEQRGVGTFGRLLPGVHDPLH